jgi:TolB-like protein/tetratricopeptide (TPR) repeat protein
MLASLIFIVLLAGIWFAHRQVDHTPLQTARAQKVTIAVLPFVDMSPDTGNGYLEDGLAVALLGKLAGLRGLKVAGQTSSFYFKGTGEPAQAVARKLQVSYLLQGRVQHSGTRVRVTAELIDAAGGVALWRKTYDRDVAEIFQIQEDIAFAVATTLQIPLLDSDKARFRRRITDDPLAYRFYLIAQSHLTGRAGSPDMGVAKRALDAAIERDPNFAAAHAGLARFYLRRVSSGMTEPEESSQLGAAAAARAVALDPASSEALQARANFQFLRYRFRGDYEAYLGGQSDMLRAIELDPFNALALDDFGRAVLWQESSRAESLFEQELQIDPGCTGGIVMLASLLGNRGQLATAVKRCTELGKRSPDASACGMAIGTLETYYGHLDTAVDQLKISAVNFPGPARIQLWSIYMSAGDSAGAQQWLDFGKSPLEKTLSDAARLAMAGRHDEAFKVLDAHRAEYPLSHLLDLPTARFALIAGRPRQALGILEQRLPDLVSGIEPITGRNLLPALDLAAAQLNTGARKDGQALLERITEYFDRPGASQLPLFAYQRARAYALSGEPDAAFRALEQAYDQGLRTTWALDLRPQSMFYIDPIDADPAFAALRSDPRFKHWLERIGAENALRIGQVNDHLAASPANGPATALQVASTRGFRAPVPIIPPFEINFRLSGQ